MRLRLRGKMRPDFKTRLLNRLFFCFIILTLLAFFYGFYFTNYIFPNICTLAKSKATYFVSKTVNKIVDENLESGALRYENLAEISIGADKRFIGIKLNSENLNDLKSKLENEVLRQVDEFTKTDFVVPLGTLFGISWLSAWGPGVKVSLLTTATSTVDFVDSFTSSGINQTVHRIYLDFLTEVEILLPKKTIKTTVDNTIMIAETIIVGEVPNYSSALEVQ